VFDLKALRERRLVQIVIAYLAGGWVAITIVGELTDRGVTPELWYRIALILFLFGIPASFVVGWFHGERGQQKVVRSEVALLSLLGIGVVFAINSVVQANARPRTAAEVDSSLDARRLAVLYFKDNSEGGQLDYVANGITEDLIDQLSRVRGLDVVSRHGSALYRDSGASADSIARALDVGTLIEGSVSGDETTIRVTVALTDGTSGAEIERAGFNVPADRLLELQDSIAVEISQSLRTWIGDEIDVRRSRNAAANVAAWALVQRASRVARDAEEVAREDGLEAALASFAKADSLLVQASRIDTMWAEPLVARARYAYRESRLADDIDRVFDFAKAGLEQANAALVLEPNSAEAYDVRGTIRYWQFLMGVTSDPDERSQLLSGARSDLEQAIQLGELATAYSTISHLYYRDDVPAAMIAAQRAYEEDAYLDVANEVLWRLYTGSYDLEQFTQARRWCQEGFRRFPEDFRFSECQLWLATTPIGDLSPDRAWEIGDQLLSVTPEGRLDYETVLSRMLVAGALGKAGLRDSALAVLDGAGTVDFESDPTQDLLSIEAFLRSTLGDNDAAIRLLSQYISANPEHAFHEGEAISWWWNDLRDDPAFQTLFSNR